MNDLVPQEQEPDFDALRAVVRLMIGVTLVGTESTLRRLQKLEREMLQHLENTEKSEDESLSDLLRFALIGFALEGQERARNGLLWGLDQGISAGLWLYGSVTPLFAQRWLRPLSNPIELRLRHYARQTEATLDRWIAVGRREDAYIRAITEDIVDDVVDDFLDYLSHNPEMMAMVQKQSMGVTADLVVSAREASILTDQWLENSLRRILRRPLRDENK